jgi:hypothetical protein
VYFFLSIKVAGNPNIAAVILIAPNITSTKLNHETNNSSIPNNYYLTSETTLFEVKGASEKRTTNNAQSEYKQILITRLFKGILMFDNFSMWRTGGEEGITK